MAQSFNIPGQNLTYSLPEDQQFFRGVGDYGSSIYKNLGNGQAQSFDLQSIGRQAYIDANPEKDQYGNYKALNGMNGGVFASKGMDILKSQYGINWSDLPSYNLGDFIQAQNQIYGKQYTPQGFSFSNGGSDLAAFIGPSFNTAQNAALNSGTSYTQTNNASNPNFADISKNGSLISGPAPTPSPGAITPTANYTNPNANYFQTQQSVPQSSPQQTSSFVNPNAVVAGPNGQPQYAYQQTTGGMPSTQGPVPTNQPMGGGNFPTSNLQPGSQGPEVQRLQDYLVSMGLMTQAEVNTGYGTYGPKTQAAVAKLQQQLGVDNSSGVGFFGPRTISALQATPHGTINPNVPINLGTGNEATYNSDLLDGGLSTQDVLDKNKSYTDTINGYLQQQADAQAKLNNLQSLQLQGMATIRNGDAVLPLQGQDLAEWEKQVAFQQLPAQIALNNANAGLNNALQMMQMNRPDTQIITDTDANGVTTATVLDKNTGKVISQQNLGKIGKPTASSSANGGLTPSQVNSTVNQIAGDFDNEPIVKAYNTVQEGFQTINDIGVNTKSPADDIAFIYAFAKIMDPNSVVREGEYNTVQKYAQTWADNFGFTAKRVFSNTNFLTSDAKQKMLNALQPKVNTISNQYNNLYSEYQRQINDAYSGKPRQLTNYVTPETGKPTVTEDSKEQAFVDITGAGNSTGYFSNLWNALFGK